MRVRYVGDVVPHLKNQWVDVPDDLHLYQATSWIEVNLKEPAIDEPVDELQGQEVAAEVDGTRFGEMDYLEQMRGELEELHQRLEQPNVAQHAEAIAATSRAMQSSWDISRDLKKLEEDARNQTAANQSLMSNAKEFADSASAERKKTNDLIAANQKIVNNAFTSYSNEMKALRRKITEADSEIRMLREAAAADRAVIQKAAKLVKAWEARE